jgi:glucosyl-dolichyl phosphate glucuronosyltransferase
MNASVVIAAYSNERLSDTLQAIDSVLCQSHPDKEIVLAVDHNAGLYQQLRLKVPGGVKVVLNDGEPGLSATRNTGIEISRGEIIAFLDDDAVAKEDWLAKLARHYTDPAVMGVGGMAVPQWTKQEADWLPPELYWVIGCTYRGYADGRVANVRNIHGNTMSFRREVFDKIGLFSTRMGHTNNLLGGDETEFCIRLTSRMPGARILYDPAVVIYHKVPPSRLTLRYLVGRAYGEGLSKGMMGSMVQSGNAALSDEKRYLRNMLTVSTRRAVKTLVKGQISYSLKRIIASLLAVGATGAGYMVSRHRPSRWWKK